MELAVVSFLRTFLSTVLSTIFDFFPSMAAMNTMTGSALTACRVGERSSNRPLSFLMKTEEGVDVKHPAQICTHSSSSSSLGKGSKFSLALHATGLTKKSASDSQLKVQAEAVRCLRTASHEDNHKILKQLSHCDMLGSLSEVVFVDNDKKIFSSGSCTKQQQYHRRLSNNTQEAAESNVQNRVTAIPSISCIDLIPLLVCPESTIILDCRSFLTYNTNHISGALNVNMANKITRKRLIDGRLTIVDLINGSEAREDYSKKEATAVIVVYDDNTTDLMSLPACHPLQLVTDNLQKEGRNVRYLHGGIQFFQGTYRHFCANPDATPTVPMLYSPTCQDVDMAVDSAKATKILPYLYIGNERDASSHETLNELGITHILNVTSHIPFHFEDKITYKRLQASDSGSQNLKQYFEEAIRFIENARVNNGCVLIHCQAGVSRSPTIVMAYIIAIFDKTLQEAFAYVHNRRSIISPNLNFMGQLLEFGQRKDQHSSLRLSQPNIDLETTE